MDQVVLVAVPHPLHDLLEECLRGLFVQLALLLHIVQKLPSLQQLHYYSYLHILEGQTIVHLYYVFVVERF